MSIRRRMLMQSADRIRHGLEVNAADSTLGTVNTTRYKKKLDGFAIYGGLIFDYQGSGQYGNILIVSKERNAGTITVNNTTVYPNVRFEYEGEAYMTNGITGRAILGDTTKLSVENGVIINSFAQIDSSLVSTDKGVSAAKELLKYYYGVI